MKNLYINLLIKTHYEAVDWWNYTKEFYEIAERAKSISAAKCALGQMSSGGRTSAKGIIEGI